MPGAFELPQAARCAAETGRFDAVVCLGCVIRGETPHFEYISSAVAHGIMEAAGETGVPIAFGVLTTDTEAQAEARAGERARQQGMRGRGRGDRDGGAVPAAGRQPRRARPPHVVRVRAGARERPMTRVDAAGRRRARRPLQMLYQAEVGRAGAARGDRRRYWPSPRRPRRRARTQPLREFANGLVRGTIARVGGDRRRCSRAHAQNWRVERMAVIDRLVLRLAVYELLADPDTPAKVVINEAIELARTFSGDEAVAFVNGVLDAVQERAESG